METTRAPKLSEKVHPSSIQPSMVDTKYRCKYVSAYSYYPMGSCFTTNTVYLTSKCNEVNDCSKLGLTNEYFITTEHYTTSSCYSRITYCSPSPSSGSSSFTQKNDLKWTLLLDMMRHIVVIYFGCIMWCSLKENRWAIRMAWIW